MSEAEERIRLRAEEALRAAFPDARIVHELVVRQGECRLDLAAITPQRIVIVEVKSEKDVLTRLRQQAEQARAVSDSFVACVAFKHITKAKELLKWSGVCSESDIGQKLQSSLFQRGVMEGLCNSPARLEMLWAQELRAIASIGPKASRRTCIAAASDRWGGSEIRKMVCGALRAREFPRADPPMLSELFQRPTRFSA